MCQLSFRSTELDRTGARKLMQFLCCLFDQEAVMERNSMQSGGGIGWLRERWQCCAELEFLLIVLCVHVCVISVQELLSTPKV